MSEFPSYRPIQQFVLDELALKRNQVYTSRLNAWIRVTSNAGSGLVLQSNPNLSLIGENGTYGNSAVPGVVGLNWAGEPVKVSGDDRGLRPSPIIEGLTLKNGTSGLTRECNFTITAYSPGQVDVLQLYFGQPGFSGLVEFGWDLEKAHNQKVSLNVASIAALNNFSNVLKKRELSKGNYANFFGFITGFKVGSDGDKYTLDVTLKGMGELPQTLKIHKHVIDDADGSDTPTQIQTGQLYTARDIKDTEDIGHKNFKYMFNSLPGHKQIASVKGLMGELGKVENFINFNEKTRESIEDETEGGNSGNDVDLNGERVRIPKGTKLIGEERFIRFGAFKKIIDTNDRQEQDKAGKIGPDPLPMKIYTDETVCNAFDRIFSTAKDRLVVPNRNVPDFGFARALKGEGATFEVGNNDCSQEADNGTKVEFPKRVKLDEGTRNGFQGLVRSPGTWGYLDDLYINFDFAVSVLEAENLTYADMLLELCNGLSTGVNSIWEFQILERACSKTLAQKYGLTVGSNILQIVEMNCTTESRQSSKRLVHNGEGSFFLSGQLDIDLPGEMANSIVADRKKLDGGGSVDVSPEGADAGGFPINKESIRDSVLDVINLAARKKKEEVDALTGTGKSQSKEPVEPDEKDIIAAVYNAFLDKVGCYPTRKDGEFNVDDKWYQKIFNSEELVDLSAILFYPCYDDQGLFKTLLSEDNPNLSPGNDKKPKGAGVLIGMLKYNFEIHGNSGISHGDNFNIIGIPSVYSKTGFFQVTNVEHTVTQMNWTTAIEGTYRAGATNEE